MYEKPESVRCVPNVDALKNLSPEIRQPGSTVWVQGYYEEGDPGAKLVRYAPESLAPDNGGTVHAPADGGAGRWLTIHHGVGHYRYFGLFGTDRDADDALDAMVNDESIYKIEADSDLNFARRHRMNRSRLVMEFNGFTVCTDGIEEAPENDPFAAVLFFQGLMTGSTQSLVLTEPLAEMSELFEVSDSSAFAVGDWWIVQSNALSGGAERELEKLIRVTEIVDATHVRFNYKNGWELAPGRTVTYKRVIPVEQVSVRNMRFIGAGGTDKTGAHPLAYEFAVECDAVGINAYGTFWPVVMRRYCTHYVTERCNLTNPVEVVIGGTGYLTQQIYCLYGHVRDCQTSNGRHLNDFTGSAYCYVENCHCDGDDLGAFVTHGQYEHDLTYVGNSGLMSFANSGPTWGESAKRITVKKHVASWFLAFRKVTDLTLEDVHVFIREGVENSANTGSFWLNPDGVQMKNCTAEAMVKFMQVSARSERPNVIENCSFALTQGRRLSHENVDAELSFRNCRFTGIDGNRFTGTGKLTFRDCSLAGASAEAGALRVEGSAFSFQGGAMANTGVVMTGTGDRQVEIGTGAAVSGTNAGKAFFTREEGDAGATDWRFFNYVSRAADADTSHYRIEAGRNTYLSAGSQFEGGRFAVAEGAFQDGSHMLHATNVENGVDRSALPGENESIRHGSNNLIINERKTTTDV